MLGEIEHLFRGLLQDSSINRWYPRGRTLQDLCTAWAKRSRIGEVPAAPPSRFRACVREACEPYRPYTMAEVRTAAARKDFSVISLFAGAGGSCTGYGHAGGEVRAVVEFGPNAAAAYKRNNPDCMVEQRDIRDVLRDPNGVEDLLQRAGLLPGELDWLDSSPPCTEFSLGGAGIGDQNRPKLHSGMWQTHVASLPFEYAKFLHRTQAKGSLMENVVGLQIRAPELLRQIVDALRFRDGERRYYANWKILSASNYGVPQKRKRIIVLSVRCDVAEKVGIYSDEDVLRLFPMPTHGTVSIRSAFEGLEQVWEDEEPYFKSLRRSQLHAALKRLPKCPPKHQRLKNVKTNFSLTRCSYDLPAPTLVIAGQKPDGLSGAIHPELDRKFTIPELKRLFGLPDDFILTGTIDEAVTCICNMVPPLLTKAVAESVYEQLLRPLATREQPTRSECAVGPGSLPHRECVD